MTRSSSFGNDGVKLDAKKAEKLLEILGPLDVNKVIEEEIGFYLGSGTRMLLELLMQKEAQEICGKWYSRSPERQAQRWGTEEGTAIYNQARRPITRPRLRQGLGEKSKEVELKSYRAINREELIDRHLTASILAGVSTRQYAKLLERSLEAKGVSRGTISRKGIASTKPTVDEFRKQRLDHLDSFT